MDAKNISLIFGPILLRTNNYDPHSNNDELKNRLTASSDCFVFMVENLKEIFQISNVLHKEISFSKDDYSIPLTLNELIENYSSSAVRQLVTQLLTNFLSVKEFSVLNSYFSCSINKFLEVKKRFKVNLRCMILI